MLGCGPQSGPVSINMRTSLQGQKPSLHPARPADYFMEWSFQVHNAIKATSRLSLKPFQFDVRHWVENWTEISSPCTVHMSARPRQRGSRVVSAHQSRLQIMVWTIKCKGGSHVMGCLQHGHLPIEQCLIIPHFEERQICHTTASSRIQPGSDMAAYWQLHCILFFAERTSSTLRAGANP